VALRQQAERREDAADEALFNEILWRTIKGPAAPYPGTRRVSGLELKREERTAYSVQRSAESPYPER
jgi:hypothetical protein